MNTLFTIENDEDKYERECKEARIANIEAHDKFPDMSGVKFERIKIIRGYRATNENSYDNNGLYLALHNGRWNLGKIGYNTFTKRWDFDLGSHSTDVDYLQQLYKIELPDIPAKLIPAPKKSERMIAKEKAEAEDEGYDWEEESDY